MNPTHDFLTELVILYPFFHSLVLDGHACVPSNLGSHNRFPCVLMLVPDLKVGIMETQDLIYKAEDDCSKTLNFKGIRWFFFCSLIIPVFQNLHLFSSPQPICQAYQNDLGQVWRWVRKTATISTSKTALMETPPWSALAGGGTWELFPSFWEEMLMWTSKTRWGCDYSNAFPLGPVEAVDFICLLLAALNINKNFLALL